MMYILYQNSVLLSMPSDFQTVPWANSTNIYEVNIRQYTQEGTLNAFATHLPRLKDMGVETLWFMPLQPIGKLNRKGTLGSYYSISDYISMNPEYGTLDGFKKLVKTAHGFGMKVLIDWVANHTSWDHVWTKTNPEFFSKDKQGNFRSPYPDWADVIHLNYDNKDLWQAMVNDMKFWVNNFDIDGFRCDMAHLVRLEFWQYARTELDKIKKIFWLAETEEPNYHEVFDVSYTWELLHTMEAYWKRETNIHGLDSVLNKYEREFPKHAIRMFFTSNHDENSHSGSEYERIGEAAKAFAVLCATWNGIPLVYSGQELPNKSRLKFFEKDAVRWTGSCELHDFYKTLLHLHSTHPALAAADEDAKTIRLVTTNETNIFSFLRSKGNKKIIVLLNLSNHYQEFYILNEKVNGKYQNIFYKVEDDIDPRKKFYMQPWEFLVYEK